jgi:enoyl-CoA hydratase
VTVEFKVTDGVGVLTIDDPRTRNALTKDTVRGLNSGIETERGNVLGFVVAARGPVFSSGADIRDFGSDAQAGTPDSPFSLLQNIWRCSVPVVAAVEGLALGGGAEVCLVCDAVLCSETAEFGFPELRLGVVPAVAAWLLPETVGRSRALGWLTTPHRLSGIEAARIGFASSVVPKGAAVQAAVALVKGMTDNVAPSALLSLRRFLRREPDWDQVMKAGEDIDPVERTEGTVAFLEKRRPNFPASPTKHEG